MKALRFHRKPGKYAAAAVAGRLRAGSGASVGGVAAGVSLLLGAAVASLTVVVTPALVAVRVGDFLRFPVTARLLE